MAADFDADLIAALKMAKGKTMFFAFVPKGPSDGKLIVSKKKIPPKEIAAARKEIGGSAPITGKCFGPVSGMTFQTVKQAPGTMKAALKIVTKRDAGMPVIAEVVLAADADTDEEEDTTTAPAPGAAAAAAPDVDTLAPAEKPAAGGDTKVAGVQTALKKLGFDPGEIDGKMGPKTKGAIVKFQQAHGLAADGIAGPKTQAALAQALKGGAAAPPSKVPPGGKGPAAPNLGPWKAAREEAIKDLKTLASKIAATKHTSAAGVLKEIQGIISKLPANPAPNEIDKLEEFVRTDDTITAAEEVPGHFHDLDIREPLLKALEGLKQ